MKDSQKLVETTNDLPIASIFNSHCPASSPTWLSLRAKIQVLQLRPGQSLQIHTLDSRSLINAQLNSCLDLIEKTSADDYRKSETGWSRAKKRREMKLPDLRYVLLSQAQDAGKTSEQPAEETVAGFVSFMITYEDGFEVIYVYEIHFAEQFRSKGLGRRLMEVVEAIGTSVGVEKAMLTVFRTNEIATTWYGKMGYKVDDFSPQVRKLRGGIVKEPTYTILSKQLREHRT